MTVASIFGKLREHEIEIQRLAVQESEDKHNKSILKASKQQPDSSGSEEDLRMYGFKLEGGVNGLKRVFANF